jgi:hypothetical protein
MSQVIRQGGLDVELSRLLHTANRPVPERRAEPVARNIVEQSVLDSAERFLRDGIALCRWWTETDACNGYAERFELQRTFNRADSSFGFFDETTLGGVPVPLMGSVQEMRYDNPRIPFSTGGPVAHWIRDQVRAFVLRYFMRVSDFRQPEAAEQLDGVTRSPAPLGLDRLSWCPRDEVIRTGFGFTQLFYKLRSSGEIGRFSDEEATAIVDLREIGPTYEWVIVKVRIFDFSVAFRPFGESGPELRFDLNEESYLILSPELVVNRDRPELGVIGDYGVGYAFIKTPEAGFLAYGPGRFDAAVEVIRFRVLDDGAIQVHMLFVANRPSSIASVSIDPIDWAIWTSDWLSAGAMSRLFGPFLDLLGRRPLRLGTVDPIYSYVSLANVVSAGQAARQLCIARDTLDKQFLVQHFKQHYQTLVGSLLTWRQIPDWTDEAGLPDWVTTGISA